MVKRISIQIISRRNYTRKYVGYARKRHSCTKRFEIIISTDYGRAGCSIVRGNGEGRNGGRRRA